MSDIIERLHTIRAHLRTGALGQREVWEEWLTEAEAEIEQLRAALQALHDWYVEYARINNLFNADGSPATFHELLEARRALEPKP